MSKPEANAYDSFRKGVLRNGDRMERVENVVGNGTPDVNFCSHGVECWIEMKAPKEPVRAKSILFRCNSNHPLRQSQKNWLMTQVQAGGECYILIATDKRWILVSGAVGDFVNDWTVDELVDNALWMTMKPIRDKSVWDDLRAVLLRRRNGDQR